MLKLFTIDDMSSFSSDAVYKICLSLDAYGVSDEDIISFGSYDMLLDAAYAALEKGDRIIIAVENGDYNNIKHELAARLMLDEVSSPVIAEAIAMNAASYDGDFDMQEQCMTVRDAICHLSYDGLYSGFSVNVMNGVCTYIPLDFSRVDSVLESFVQLVLEQRSDASDEAEAPQSEKSTSYDFKEPVSKMIYSLVQVDKHVAIATSEATMWIYELYDKIDGLSDVVNFVEIIDDEPQGEKPMQAEASGQQEETDLPVDPTDEEAEQREAADEQQEETEKESISAKTIRHAREAMRNTQSDFGAAISDVYTSEAEDGTVNYFAFVAVSDNTSTKAKKINTTNPEEAEMLLPHCVTVLSETVCQKVDAVSSALLTPEKEEEKKEEKKLSKGMIIFAAVVLLIAIISPIYIVHTIVAKGSTTAQPTVDAIATGNLGYTTTLSSFETQTTEASVFPGTNDSTSDTTINNALIAAEPSASDVLVSATVPSVTSTSGTFTFYVFGYGHGCGLSQCGANYLASIGWNYAQILANYYYGAILMSGDAYPETISYNGQDYQTRDFLACVLEAEMGSSFLPEALKAQAVAAYTFAKYYAYKIDSSGMAFKSSGASKACYDAVDEIMKNGLYIATEGRQTALTPFHAISAGVTTSYNNVWGGTALTYLGGGRPSYGDYNADGFKSTYTITSSELKATVESKNLGITFSGDPATWLSIISHDAAVNENIGYVSSINVGGKIMSGNDFRVKVLGGLIRSHCFYIVYTPDNA